MGGIPSAQPGRSTTSRENSNQTSLQALCLTQPYHVRLAADKYAMDPLRSGLSAGLEAAAGETTAGEITDASEEGARQQRAENWLR